MTPVTSRMDSCVQNVPMAAGGVDSVGSPIRTGEQNTDPNSGKLYEVEVGKGCPNMQKLFHKSGRGAEEDRSGGNNGLRQGELFQVKSWKTLFSAKPGTISPLEFVAPERVNGKLVKQPPAEAVVKGMKLWEDYLVGQFFL